MSSFLCFICHSTVNNDTNEDMREKYREVVGMNLCPDSHLCHICCHVLNRLWLFRSVCLKRSLEYPVLFSEKGTLNLQRNDLEIHTVCFEDCEHYKNRNINSKYYHFKYFDDAVDSNEEYPSYPNDYVKFDDGRIEFEEFHDKPHYQEDIHKNAEPEYAQNFSEDLNDEKSNDGYEEDCNFDENYDNPNDNYGNDRNFDSNDENVNEDCEEEKILEQGCEADDKYDSEEYNSTTILETNQESLKNKAKKHGKKKSKSKKEKPPFVKFKLSVTEQKSELEKNRKTKKYVEAEFKCYNCAQGFLFKDTYQAHMMRHEESNGEYRCGICTLRFATPAVLRAHTAIHAERHKCTKCGDVVRPRHRTSHARACRNLPVEGVACHLCGNMFNGPNALQQHLKRFHRSKDTGRTYACTVCGERYNDQAAVRTHMIKHIQRKFRCSECPSMFSSPYSLRRHKKKHDTPQLPRVKRPRAPLDINSFVCPTCGRACPTRRSLSSHSCSAAPRPRPRPRDPPRAVCHRCGAKFKGNNKLNRHLKQVCEKEKWEEEQITTYC